ncbi:unnamed protein product [Phytomonas sp. EM1]|nr:unnamed protein product [Phytomonas sp. EM1]|eukprot:CCW64459.1 unnamed protein product [Phytomonas sp. isolate EM1]
MEGHKCSLHNDKEASPLDEEGTLMPVASAPGSNTSMDKQLQADKLPSLPLPTNSSSSPVQLSVNGLGGDQLESMQSKSLSPQDAATAENGITIPAGAVLRKRAIEKCNNDSNHQDSAARRVLRQHKLPTDLPNHSTAASSTTLNMSATGMGNERRLASPRGPPSASNIVANPIISALPTLSNRLKLSEGLSCIDYLPAFRALAIGSTRQLHIVEVIPAVSYDVYRYNHEQIWNSRQQKAETSWDTDNEDFAARDVNEKGGGQGTPPRMREALPTQAISTPSRRTPPGAYIPDSRCGGSSSPGAAEFTCASNESHVKWCRDNSSTAYNTLENPSIQTFTSFCRRSVPSGSQPSLANSSSPYVLRNAGVFGGLMKVESVAWYPSCNEASLAFVQPGRAVTVFLDVLQFKSDGSYVSQQWKRSQGKGKTLHATLSVGGGSTATAVVAPSGCMLFSWPMKTSLTTSLSTPGWGKGGQTVALTNPTMTPSSCSGNGPEQASVERSPGGVFAKKLIELAIDCTYVRVECIAWDPHNPHTLALSSNLTHFELWHIPTVGDRVYAPQLVLRPPAHNTRSVARSLAFSPSDANLIIVVVESASAGQVLLFDRRQVEVPRSLDVMGPGLTAAFHPIFSDLLAVCFRKAKTKTDCRVAFLRVLEDSQQAEIVKTAVPAQTSVGDASYTEILSGSTSSATVAKGMQHHHSDVPREGHGDVSSDAINSALTATMAGTEALLTSAGVMEVPRVVQQDILQPIDHYASVNRLQWRPGSCGMKLSAESPDHHFRCWFPSPEPFIALRSAGEVTSHLGSSCFTGSTSTAAARRRDRSQDFAEKPEGVTPETEEMLKTASYARLKSGVELLASQLWFATAATTTDSDVCVWDAVSGFVPVCVASHQSKDGRELNDFTWVNELTLVTVFKSGEVICTCLMNNNHFEDSVLVCPSLGASEDDAMTSTTTKIPQQQGHLSPVSGATPNPERAANDHGHMMLCYPPDDAVRVLSLHSIMPTSAVTCDLFGRSFVVRNTSSRLKNYYQCVIQSERKDLIRRLLIQVGNEEIQRERVAQRRGIRIHVHYRFEEILQALFGDAKYNVQATICDIVRQDAGDRAVQPSHTEINRCDWGFPNAETAAPSFLFFPTLTSSRERATGMERREKNAETGDGIEPLSVTGLDETLMLTTSSQSVAKPRRRQQNTRTQFFSRILGFIQHPLSLGHQERPLEISGVDGSTATMNMGSAATDDARAPHSSVQGGQYTHNDLVDINRLGTAAEIKSRANMGTSHLSTRVASDLQQHQLYRGGSTSLYETPNVMDRISGNNDATCLQDVTRHHSTLSDVSSVGQRNKISMGQDCTSQKPHHQTPARSFPVVNAISQRSPDYRHMSIFPLISSPTKVYIEQGPTAPASPISVISAFADGLAVIKHSGANPLEREPLVSTNDHKNLVFSKEELSVVSDSQTASCKISPTIRRDKMGLFVLERTAFPQSPKINPTVTIPISAMLRRDNAIPISLTPEVLQNSPPGYSSAREVTSLNSDNRNDNTACAGGSLSEASLKLWTILNTASMQHCVNPVIENCVLSNAVCTWAYTECQTETNLFVRYALEWDMGYELALTMKRHRHWLDDEAEKEESNCQEKLQKPGRKSSVLLYHKDKKKKLHGLSASASRPQQHVLLQSPKQIDIIFSNMMSHNYRICKAQYDPSAAKGRKSGNSVGNDDGDRSPQDPRAQFWRAASYAWRTHNLETILSVTTSQLEYTSLMGDVQYSLVLYVLFCLWWRLRYHSPQHVAAGFPSQAESTAENDTQPEHRESVDQEGRDHYTWQYLRPDPSDYASSINHTSPLGQEVVKDKPGFAQNFSAMPPCPLLPGRSSKPQTVKQRETSQPFPHVSETRSPETSRLSSAKANTFFPAQPVNTTERHEDSTTCVKSTPNICSCDASCTPEQWKLRALQWLEVYTSELYACRLYVPLNELLLIIPELFQEPYNPVQPRAADIAYEKQMTYVFCGNCTKSELCTLPVKGLDLPTYSSSPTTTVMYRSNHHASDTHIGMGREKVYRWQKKDSTNTYLPSSAMNASEASKTLTSIYSESQLSQIKLSLKERRKQLLKEPPRMAKMKRRKGCIRASSVLGVSHSADFLSVLNYSDSSQKTHESDDSYSVDHSHIFSRMSSTHSLSTSTTTENLSIPLQSEFESLSLPAYRRRARDDRCAELACAHLDMGNRANPHNAPTMSWRSADDDALVNDVDDEMGMDAVETEEMSIQLLPGHAIPNNAECRHCHNTTAMTCVVCEEVVEGLFYWLRSCGHGGHVHHMQQWMTISSDCPKCGVPITSAASQK